MGSRAFDKLLYKNVPHILEKIYLSLDYESYKECFEVCRTWNEILTSKRYLKIGKSVFQDKISEDERKLLEAAESDNTTDVRKLLRNRMLDINSRHGFFLYTPLHKAAKNYRGAAVVQLLMNGGADPNARDNNGKTPLHNAAYYGCRAIIVLLLDEGADPNGSDEYGETPLHKGAKNGSKEIVQLLLERGAEVNKPNKNGLTPLHYAAIHDYKGMVQILLKGGAEVNQPNKFGMTSLHEVARLGYKDIVQILLKNGAVLSATYEGGHTPLSLAKEHGHEDIAKVIMRFIKKQK